MTFNDFELHESLQLGLNDVGYAEPTPIQEKSIPLALQGKDILGAAQTGTGKTGAFVIPIIEQILRAPSEGIQALILSPTRELAQQIDEQIFALGYHTGITSATIIGGEDFARQANAIRAGVDILVATPGRLIDQMKVLDIDFDHIRFLVLDEADRMLDMGFLPDVTHIIDRVPKERQTMLFSATLPKELQKLMKSIMKDPEEIKIEVSTTSKRVDQRAYYAPPRKKLGLVQHLLDELEWTSCIIFSATKKGTNELEKLLKSKGVNAGSIHGDRTQDERNASLRAFKNGEVPVIVATDVLARGIDIDNVSVIINYDVPKAVEDYIHRIGRTGRYDKEGIAVTLVSKADEKFFNPIKKKVGPELKVLDLPEKLDSKKANSKKSGSEKQKKDSSVSPDDNRKKTARAEQAEPLKPGVIKKKTVTIEVSREGKVVVTLNDKARDKKEAKAKEKPQPPKSGKRQEKKKEGPRKQQRDSKAKKPGNKKGAGRSKRNDYKAPERIEKATKRNQNVRKPSKGVWGLIKSMIPRFGKD